MKLFIKYKINQKQADVLIEKYYEGLTTVEQEKELQLFLTQPGLPEKYRVEQAMFAYLKPVRKNKSLHIFLRYAAVAALLLLGTYSVQTFFTKTHDGYAYVDGKKVTNKKQITELAMATISEISSSNNEVEQELNEINNSELIKQQLDVFNSIEDLK